jgi:opacity protein-like surface antigen
MRHASAAIAVLAVLSAGSLHAQEEAGQYRTAISAVGGLSVGSSRSLGRGDERGGFGGFGEFGGHEGSGFAVGGGLAHDLSSRLTLEATGLYLDRGSSAWSADVGLRVNLEPSGRSLVPYFAVSGGVYGERSERLAGSLGAHDDAQESDGNRDGRGQTGRNVTTFRPGRGATGRDAGLVSTSSHRTNGMMTLGGGVQFAAGPHVFVRPDARAQVLFGDTRVLGLFTLNFGYRF